MQDISAFLFHLKHWAADQPLAAVVLVGSCARGANTDESDVDLVLMTASPPTYLQDHDWLREFGSVMEVRDEDWGMVQSKRVFYKDGLEVEFGITTPQWAAIDPTDEGTRRVISDGAQIICDPHGILAALIAAVDSRPVSEAEHYSTGT